ncbi:MAG: carbamoylphosphate synthase large subunit, partial [Solobacterium sp.]|nr:carbamoylphosphate synthase large subunit [Solobacterium sp.]
KMGTAVIKSFDIKGRFFHTEYFRLTEDKKGLGKKGDLVGLEVNMRPPGGYTPDMMNYANDINVYAIYANMAMFNTAPEESDRPYSVAFAGRRDHLSYKNDASAVYAKYGQKIVMHGRMPELLAEAMGNEFFMARFKTEKEVKAFLKFIFEKAG